MLLRRDAIRQGRNFYVTGIPCHNGHFALRRVSNCNCIECESVYGKKYKKDNETFLKLQRQEYVQRNCEKIAKQKQRYSKKYRKLAKVKVKRNRKFILESGLWPAPSDACRQ